jgi:hypothetical protein
MEWMLLGDGVGRPSCGTVALYGVFIYLFFLADGTVALYGLFIYLFFLADDRATDFTLSKICGTAPRIRRTFQQ